MKTILALFLIPSLLLADGVVLFEKTTGIIQERYVQMVTTNHDDGVVSTNILCAFQKLQPKGTIADGNKVLGAQVLKRVDWSIYDLARYQGKPVDPQTTNDLNQPVAFDVFGQQDATAKQQKDSDDLRIMAESNILVIADGLGLTDRPVKWTKLMNKIENKIEDNCTNGLCISSRVQAWLIMYTQNGGDAWRIGK